MLGISKVTDMTKNLFPDGFGASTKQMSDLSSILTDNITAADDDRVLALDRRPRRADQLDTARGRTRGQRIVTEH